MPDPARPSAAASLMATIARAADRHALAVDGADARLGYAELLGRSRALAARLAVRRGPVLVYGHKEPALVVAFVAALRAGRAYVPADPSLPPSRVARMIELARPRDAILTGATPAAVTASLVARGVEPILIGGHDASGGGAGDADAAAADDDAPAYIVFTSGTTGDPKGVPIPYRALAHFASWLTGPPGLGRGEVVLDQAPYTFDLSVMAVYAALLNGGALFPVTADQVADPRALVTRLDGAPITTWVSTPSFARFCAAEPRFGREMLPRLSRFLFCGETLPPSLVLDLHARFPGAVVWNTYGPTETTVAVTGMRVDPSSAGSGRPLPIGRPFSGMDVWIADTGDPAHRLAAGRSGEIVIAGPQLAAGYLGAGEARNAFVTLPDGRRAYRTGDLGHADAEGLLYCEGRLDRQVKLHGYRLELDEIEHEVRRVSGVADVAVVAVDCDGRPDHLVAFVVPVPDAGLPAGDVALARVLRDGLVARLPAYALPRSFRRVASLPLTANGKVDRAALRELVQ